jgi:hypothetical protein
MTAAAYTTGSGEIVLRPRLRLSSLNGAATTFSIGARNTTDNADLFFFSQAKRVAADTSAGFVLPSFPAAPSKTYALLIYSTNTSDTATAYIVDWFDARQADATQWAGVDTATTGTTGSIAAERGGTLATTTNITAGTIGSVTNAVLIQNGTASGQLVTINGAAFADIVAVNSNGNSANGLENAGEDYLNGDKFDVNVASFSAGAITAAAIAANALNGKGDWNTTTPPTTAQIRTELATELARIDVATSTRATPAQILSNTANLLLTNSAGYVTTTGGSVTIDAQDIRDAMTLATTANAASGSIDNKLDGIKAKTDTIATGGNVTTMLRETSHIVLVQGASYTFAKGTHLLFEKSSRDVWPSDIDTGGYSVGITFTPVGGGTPITVSGGTIIDADSVRIDVSDTVTSAMTAASGKTPNYLHQVWAKIGTANPFCLDDGHTVIIDDIRS